MTLTVFVFVLLKRLEPSVPGHWHTGYLCSASAHSLIYIFLASADVSLGPQDPVFVTPLVKCLLKKRLYLRKHGGVQEADALVVRINELIRDIRRKHLFGMADASNHQLWQATKNTSKGADYLYRLFHDVDMVSHFAKIATDPAYSESDVLQCVKSLNNTHLTNGAMIENYEIEILLRNMKASSPGADGISSWFFRHCSYELAEVVAHIFKISVFTGTVPCQCRCAIVTTIPKVSSQHL